MDEVTEWLQKSNKPIYLQGNSGSGKTHLLRQLPHVTFVSIHDIQEYDDLVKCVQPTVYEMFCTDTTPVKICVIDDLDFLQNHEKKVMKTFLKQFKLEEKNKKKRAFPLILSGTNVHEKIVKEIMKTCNVVKMRRELPLRHNLYEKNIQHSIRQIMMKEFDADFVTENEKATQALLFHENMVDLIKTEDQLTFYYMFLRNFCVGDYFDRISFQKQLWVYNEMTYYIKILQNYCLYQKEPTIMPRKVPDEYRFTKVLTKYSNEYNNNIFILGLCTKLGCSKKELFYRILRKDATTCEALTPIELNRVSVYFHLKPNPSSAASSSSEETLE